MDNLRREPTSPEVVAGDHGAVSWGAVFAGGVAAAAFGLILLSLGSGLGLSALSPWDNAGHEATIFGFAAIVWVCITQIMTCGLGGYIAGRLRIRWAAASRDEVYFRDTTHGFLVWAVATLSTAAALGSALGGVVHNEPQIAGAANASFRQSARPSGGDADANTPWPVGYLVDSLFRMPAGATAPIVPTATGVAACPALPDSIPRGEVTRILLNSAMTASPLSSNDSAYLARLVSTRTGLQEADAQARVNYTYSELVQKLHAINTAARAEADKAHHTGIHVALWLFISLLMGAFSACLMATYGGRTRDLI